MVNLLPGILRAIVLSALLFIAPPPPAGAEVAETSPTPELFAPGVVSKPDRHEFGVAVTSDGSEVFFGVDTGQGLEIWHAKKNGDAWGPDLPLLQDPDIRFNDPALDPGERRLYFISTATPDGVPRDTPKNADIWYIERRGDGWSKPIHTGPVINTEAAEFYISFTDDGDLYFASNRGASREGNYDLYFSPNGLTEPEAPIRLGPGVNSGAYEADVFVVPDGSYVVFAAGRRGGLGRGDLHISFRGDDGTFEKSKNLGAPINTAGHELCPVVSRDGKYLYYTSAQDIYRIGTDALWVHR